MSHDRLFDLRKHEQLLDIENKNGAFDMMPSAACKRLSEGNKEGVLERKFLISDLKKYSASFSGWVVKWCTLHWNVFDTVNAGRPEVAFEL